MKFRFGGLATAARGRFNSQLGGMVIGLNGVARAFSTPTNPQTASQTENRNLFLFLTQAFSNLTTAQITAWEVARNSDAWTTSDAISGAQRKFSSAKALFIFVNTNVAIASGTVNAPSVSVPTPLPPVALPAIGVTSIVADASASTMVVNYTGALDDSRLLLRMTPPVSPGIQRMTSVRSALRSLDIFNGATPLSAGSAYQALYPASIAPANEGKGIGYTVEQIDINTGTRGLIASGFLTIVE